MEKELQNWKKTVDFARQEFYELNYYTTVQLVTLRRELSMEKTASNVATKVLMLLQSISTQVTSGIVRDVVSSVITSAASGLECAVQSDQSEVVSESVAAIPVENSHIVTRPKLFPDMPKLTDAELTDDQRVILEFVTRTLDCSKLLVLKAFECHEKVMDKFDYRTWCAEHLEAFEFEEDSSSESEDEQDESMSIYSDSESEEIKNKSQGM